jgi:TolB-like protein/cytochrome c-type biogenesis protein CcmH/NrfG
MVALVGLSCNGSGGYAFVADVREVIDDTEEIITARQTVSKIEIEEITLENSDQPAFVSSAPPGLVRTNVSKFEWLKNRRTLLAAFALLIVAIGAGIYFFKARQIPATSQIKSIAVLPFKTINAAKENEHQGLGLADILITRLSSIKQINVRPTGAIYEFENKEIDIAQASQKLNADAILEGTIYYAGEKVRITARLIKSGDQTILWSGNFEQLAQDELKIQSEIALQVTDALTINLTKNEKNALSKNPTENEDAYQLYLKGRYHWNKRDLRGVAEAERYFRNAIEKDPKFALAYVGLADKLLLSDSSEASVALAKAIELDPNLGEAYASFGFYNTFHTWDWEAAEENFKKAIEFNPGYGTAHQWYATYLMIRGKHTEAVAELRRALELNPNSYNYLSDLGQAYYFARDYETAEKYCRQALEIYPEFNFAHQNLMFIYFQKEDYEQALTERMFFRFAFVDPSLEYADYKESVRRDTQKLTDAFRKGGSKGFWKFFLEYSQADVDKNPNTFLAQGWILGKLGEKQKALDTLEKAVDRRAFLAPFLKVDPQYDELRNEPRFQNILRKMNLLN